MKNSIFRISSLASLLVPTVLLAAAPVISVDFRSVEEGVVESAERNYFLHLGEKVSVEADGPTGKPFLRFDGSPASTVRVDGRGASSKVKGDEVSVSLWFRMDRIAKGDIAYGFYCDGAKTAPGWPNWGEIPLRYSAKLEATDFGSYELWSRAEGLLPTNVWHHLAMTYSMSNLQFNVWYDGRLQRSIKTDQDLPRPIKGLFSLPMAKDFAGAIADIRIWNTVVADDELLSMDVSRKMADALAARYEKAAASVAADPSAKPFQEWCASSAKGARALAAAGKGNVRDWVALQEGGEALPYLVERVRELGGSKDSSLGQMPCLPISIYPYHMNKRLPWKLPEDGKSPGRVSVSGAPGEYEAASVMVYPFRDVERFHVVPGDLTGPGGAKIPASAVDLRVVKCWFTPRGGWNSYFGGGREYGTLAPELILHDDAFLKVDRDKRANYVRCSYPAGDRYILTSEFGTPENLEALNFELDPMFDAKTFQPLPLVHGELRQLWITVAIPSDAKAGLYKGSLDFTEGGKPCGTMAITLDVHSFPLPRAATRYNIDKPFYGTWMNGIGLDRKVTAGMNFSNAVRRLRAEYKSMATHNMLHPWTTAFANPRYPDFADVQLDLMKEAGLAMKPIFSDITGCDPGWIGMGRDIRRYNGDISVEANHDFFVQRQIAFSNYVNDAMTHLEKKLGHREVFCYGADEAGPSTVRREMPGFMTIRALGGNPFITMSIAKWASYAVACDDVPASMGRTHAQAWHEGGAMCTTYAAPFAGPENPECWRRNKGIRLYSANFDGCNEYVWYAGVDVWNDFVFDSRYKPFCIVYPVADGVLDTVAWEALREGFDDVRYLTLLRRLARLAMRAADRPLARLGKTATAWAISINSETVDLDVMRSEAVDWIDRLRAALAEKGVEVPESVYR